MKLAIVFPGQGSQQVGMGRAWCAAYPAAQAVFDRANAALGMELASLCFDGPEEQLKLTENTQPAILTASYAAYEAIRDELPAPAFMAGHSLGEYTALVAAGALSFEDAVRTTRERGRLMQSTVPVGEGAMAAVIGLGQQRISTINAEVATRTGAPLEVANLNSLEQTVVSGGASAVAAALPLYSEAGARRVVELAVSAPFHSSLMLPAADGLLPQLRALNLSSVATPVVANLTAQPYPANTSQYPLLLHAQIFNPVRWTETVQYFEQQGVTHLLEIGPGKVLRMLTPKITTGIRAASLEDPAQLTEVRSWLEELA